MAHLALLVILAASDRRSPNATRLCEINTRTGPQKWACPTNQFCGESVNACGAYGCGGQNDAECPGELACCSEGPLPPGGQPTRRASDPAHFCFNRSADETCCGSASPACRHDQTCCLTNMTTTAAGLGQGQYPPPRWDASWCVDTKASPPPKDPLRPDSPGSCCLDSHGTLSYACPNGACCGTDPGGSGGAGSNSCIDPESEQCCVGDTRHQCPDCGWACKKYQLCGPDYFSCVEEPHGKCAKRLGQLCPDRTSIDACDNCCEQHAQELYNATCTNYDFDEWCNT